MHGNSETNYATGDPMLIQQHFPRVVAITFVRMRRNSVNSASGLKTAVTIDISGYDFV